MTQRPVFLIVIAVLGITLLILVVGLYSMSVNSSSRITELSKINSTLQDSVATLQATVNKLADQAPGLGEYMSTFQLHMGKLWYAGRASNWELANYELGELAETMQAAEALHAVKHNIHTSSILRSVQNTQLPLLRQALEKKNQRRFQAAYEQTLETCNTCHRSVGYGFIHITKPQGPPVTNQSWKLTQ